MELEWSLVGITKFQSLNYLNLVRNYNIVPYQKFKKYIYIYVIKHNLKRGRREHNENQL